jgi:transposase
VADERDALIAELRRMNEQLGALVAQQQSVMAAQRQLISELEQRLVEQDAAHAARAAGLEAEVRRLERELLGPKTEKIKVPPVDGDLGKDAPTEEELARRREEIAKKRRERALARKAMPTEEITHPVPEEAKRCPKCNGTRFGALGFETSTTYEYVPGRFVRRVHRREKVACSCGECVLVAPAPPKLVPGGQYGFGFAAFLVVEKCADSIPIHRIERRFERLGIPMSRATMNDVFHAAAERIAPLIARLRARIAGLSLVLADETSIRLQDRQKRGFVWVFHGRDDTTNGELVLYVFATDRSGETPAQILGGTQGILVVDGYTGYNNVTDPTGRARGGCWCHLRRKLFEARRTTGDDADVGIDKIRPLFRVEHEATALDIVGTPDHLEMRQQRSRPIVDDFFEWAKDVRSRILPRSPLAEALGYAINQRDRLELFLTDARIPIHNNASERRLRVVALGRKNYLFVGHPRAGRNLAGLYSLVGSCIANRVEPTEYLTDILPRVAAAKTDADLDELLPDRWTPPVPSVAVLNDIDDA